MLWQSSFPTGDLIVIMVVSVGKESNGTVNVFYGSIGISNSRCAEREKDVYQVASKSPLPNQLE
jgi:hypothetical protein